MIHLSKPTAEEIRAFLAEQSKHSLTYAEVGATAGQPPAGYQVHHTRVKLGVGPDVYRAAQAALRDWAQYDSAWLSAQPPQTPIRKDECVAVVARAFGFWWVNACRIVYVIDETGDTNRYGFAYGTLPAHIGKGEERFLIEWDTKENSVWFDILAFSKSQHIMSKLGYPFFRLTQKSFGRSAANSMQKAPNVPRDVPTGFR